MLVLPDNWLTETADVIQRGAEPYRTGNVASAGLELGGRSQVLGPLERDIGDEFA